MQGFKNKFIPYFTVANARIAFVIMTLTLFSAGSARANDVDVEGFPAYVEKLKEEALAHGISAATIEKAFVDVSFYERAVTADRNQPEFTITLDTYLPRAVPDWKVRQGIEKYNEHKELLERIGAEYGVQPRFIVALWGIETNYGGYTGNFRVISSLSTLAYEGRREEFFKRQLMQALEIIDAGHIEPEQMRGSWAGAMGQTQFMPSSFLSYAVDGDGDGKIDIWNSYADVFSSAANYLANVGWDDTKTWGRQVQLPEGFDVESAGLGTKKLLSEWQDLGIRRYDGSDLPTREIPASVIIPDGVDGRAFLAYHNWDVLMRWNRSNYFVVVVGHLSDRIQMGQ
ncbi:lytic murein transglycosylase [Aliidiomarina shirensis]|uniref:Lytic murein transglycosylase n=1 Tax=Aliidiomarina shirensis TaxID=1048642 RepID=A0A432WTW7_9GAMM|nr:lytic murein transglycosylase [Aliidiomarina shirensis]RUO37220.1 lytic murein transglycosylase [Aliidiomarina shirensis]